MKRSPIVLVACLALVLVAALWSWAELGGSAVAPRAEDPVTVAPRGVTVLAEGTFESPSTAGSPAAAREALEGETLGDGRISGWVESEVGRVAGAEVFALVGSAEGRVSFKRVSDEEGRFELRGLPAGEVRLNVFAAEYHNESQELGLLAEGAQWTGVAVLLRRGNVVEGVVLEPSGSPLAGAQVQLARTGSVHSWSSGHFESAKTRITDEAGRFLFGAQEPGPFHLSARFPAPGEDDVTTRLHAALRGVRPNEAPVTLILEPTQAVEGVCVDDVGAPVSDFIVVARSKIADRLGGGELHTVHVAVEDAASGRFTLEGLWDGIWDLSVNNDTHGLSSVVPFEVPREGPPLRVVLPRPAVVRGTVHDASGAPTEDAIVHIAGASSGSAHADWWALSAVTDLSTDERGEFELQPLRPGRYRLTAQQDGSVVSTPVEIEARAGETLEGVRLELRRAARLEVTLHESLGHEGIAMIALVRSGGDQDHLNLEGPRAVIENLEPGEVLVRYKPFEHALATDRMLGNVVEVPVTLSAGETASVVLGAPSPEAVRLFGTVTSGGEPLAEALVGAFPETLASWSYGRVLARADASGRYELVLPRGGPWKIGAGADNPLRTTPFVLEVDVPETASDHRLDVALPTGRLSGTVLDADGRPAVWLMARLSRGDFFHTAQTDEEGSFGFTHLEPGRYDLRVGGDAWFSMQFVDSSVASAPVEGGMRLLREVEVRAEGETELAIELEPAAEVSVTVVDASGNGLVSAEVRIETEDGLSLLAFSPLLTDEAGRALVGGLPPGQVHVQARLGERTSERRRLELTPSELGTLRLVVRD